MANPIVDALLTLLPTPTHPYTGADQTAGAHAALQKALDHYKSGQIVLPPVGADLSHSTRIRLVSLSAHPGLSITHMDVVHICANHSTLVHVPRLFMGR